MVSRGAALAAAFAVAWPAAAQAKFNEGTAKYTTGVNCSSIIFNQPRVERQTAAYAAQEVPDDGSVPSGDRPFWVKVVFGSVGDICGGGGHALPEFIPPVGVTINPAQQPYWTAWSDGVERRAAEPIVVRPGPNGGYALTVVDPADNQDKPFIYANNGPFINVYLPLRTTRALNGIGTPQPYCAQITDDTGACPASQAGDHLQVHTQVAGGSPSQLIPFVGLFATEPSKPVAGQPRQAPGAPALAIRAPAKVTRAGLRRGITITVPAQPVGTRVRATLKRGRTVLARADGRSRSAKKALRLRLKARRAVPRGRLTLTVRATPPGGGAATTATRTLRVT